MTLHMGLLHSLGAAQYSTKFMNENLLIKSPDEHSGYFYFCYYWRKVNKNLFLFCMTISPLVHSLALFRWQLKMGVSTILLSYVTPKLVSCILIGRMINILTRSHIFGSLSVWHNLKIIYVYVTMSQEVLSPVGYEAFKPGQKTCPLHVNHVLLDLSCTILTAARTPTEEEYLMLPCWQAAVPVNILCE